MSTTTVQEEQRDKFLPTLRKGQDVALDALKTLVEAVQFVAPASRAVHGRVAHRLPPAHRIVADANEFAERLLANQRKFADEVIDVMSPLLVSKAGEPIGAGGEDEVPVGSEGGPARPSRAGKSAAGREGKPAAA
jgi:hypothetical protein